MHLVKPSNGLPCFWLIRNSNAITRFRKDLRKICGRGVNSMTSLSLPVFGMQCASTAVSYQSEVVSSLMAPSSSSSMCFCFGPTTQNFPSLTRQTLGCHCSSYANCPSSLTNKSLSITGTSKRTNCFFI